MVQKNKSALVLAFAIGLLTASVSEGRDRQVGEQSMRKTTSSGNFCKNPHAKRLSRHAGDQQTQSGNRQGR